MAARGISVNLISQFNPKGFIEAEKASKGLSGQFRDLGAQAGAMFATAQVAQFAKSSIAAASDLGESINAVNVTFGEASDSILKLGENAATTVGMSNREFNAFAVQFSGFTKQIAQSDSEIASVTDDLTTRIADFASVMNLDVAEAAQVFQSSLAGQTEPIRKFGVDMSAAAVELFALETGLVKSKAEMTEAIKVQARYALIMQETSKVAGDFANTSDSLANQSRILSARFDDLQATAGQALIPALEGALNVALPMLDAFSALPESLQQVTVGAGAAAIGFSSASKSLQGFGLAARTANLSLGAVGLVLGGVAIALAEVKRQQDLAAERQDLLTQEFVDAGDPVFTLQGRIDDLAESLKDLKDGGDDASDGVEQITGLIGSVTLQAQLAERGVAGAFDEIGMAIEDVIPIISTGTDEFSALSKTASEQDMRVLVGQLEGAERAFGDMVIAAMEAGEITSVEAMNIFDALDETADAFDDARESAEDLAREYFNSGEAASDFSHIVGSELNVILGRAEDGTITYVEAQEELLRVAGPLGQAIREQSGDMWNLSVDVDAVNAQFADFVEGASNTEGSLGDLGGVLGDSRSDFNELETSIRDARIEMELLRGSLDARDVYLNLRDDLEETMETVLDSEATFREKEQAVIDSKNSVLDYADVLGSGVIPPEMVTELFTLIDEGSYIEAARRLDLLERGRVAGFDVTMPSDSAFNRALEQNAPKVPVGVGALGGLVTQPTLALIGERGSEAVMPLNRMPGASPLPSDMGAPMYVTINMPVGSNGEDVVRALRTQARRTGALTIPTSSAVRR